MILCWATFIAISDHMPQAEHSWQTFKSNLRHFEKIVHTLPDTVICSTYSNTTVYILLCINITHQPLLHIEFHERLQIFRFNWSGVESSIDALNKYV